AVQQRENTKAIDDLVANATRRQQLVAQLNQLKSAFDAKPSPEAAQKLVQKYLIDMDDPDSALTYALASGQTTTINRLRAINSPSDKISEAQLLDLGGWYTELVADIP